MEVQSPKCMENQDGGVPLGELELLQFCCYNAMAYGNMKVETINFKATFKNNSLNVAACSFFNFAQYQPGLNKNNIFK